MGEAAVRRLTRGVALIIGVLALFGSGQALAGGQAPTEIVVTRTTGGAPGSVFEAKGTLESTSRCLGGRKMKLVFVDFAGAKRTVDKGESRQGGKWKLSGRVRDSDSDAFVKVNGRPGCAGAKASALTETR